MIIKIKNTEVLDSIMTHVFDPMLVKVLTDFCQATNYATITEGYRPQHHPNDLHGTDPVRAVDLRSWCYPEPTMLARDFNTVWEYDYKRPHMEVLVYHKSGRDARHFHLQVHPHTRRRI